MNHLLKILSVFLIFIFPVKPILADQEIDINNQDISVNFPLVVMGHIEVEIELVIIDPDIKEQFNGKDITFLINNKINIFTVQDGKIIVPVTFNEKQDFTIQSGQFFYSKKVHPIPLWFSIIPPLIAILMALLFKEVFSALFIGLLVGTMTIYFFGGESLFNAFFKGMFAIVDTYLISSLSNSDHVSIIVFSMLIGAMVSLITTNGGMKGIVNYLSKYAKSPRGGQFITWVMGLCIFFDDYANTLVVGNTMRPVTDRLKISREKLAYIVDSTAAPIASVAFVTTWIGAELSYIQDGINFLDIPESPYIIFLNSLAYSFYPILTLFFVFMLIYKQRDFGPMLSAERVSVKSGQPANQEWVVEPHNTSGEFEIRQGIHPRWFNAFIPVLVVVLGTFAGLFFTGWDNEIWNSDQLGFTGKLSAIIGGSNSYKALLWASLSGVLVAVVLTLAQRLLSLQETMDGLLTGFKTMLTAIVILVLAWSIALLTKHLHTAEFISITLVKISVSPYILPALTFILSAFVAFSTGSSWGTMAILYPLILPASWLLCEQYGLDYDASISIFHNVVATVLTGSVLGDHVSPISDTTILSSLSSSCNHISHVKTQMPYALTVGGVAIVFGIVPASYGVPSYLLFIVCGLILYGIIVLFGKKNLATMI